MTQHAQSAGSPAWDQPHPEIERMVVGYDLSEGANAAASFALWLTTRAPVEVTFVHACPGIEAVASADLVPAGAFEEVAYERDWQRRLDGLRGYAAPDAHVHTRLERGSPAAALLAAAEQADADLIAIGSHHGVGRMRGFFLGSVSSQVLLHASRSVLLFRDDNVAEQPERPRTVIVCLDGSECSDVALRTAQALAVPLAAKLVLLHVADPYTPLSSQPMSAARNEILRYGRKVLHKARETVAAPMEVIEEEILEGHVRDQILAAAERHAPAMLVLGTRGLGGFKELLVGSTSHWAANHAPCPVLVARTPKLRAPRS